MGRPHREGAHIMRVQPPRARLHPLRLHLRVLPGRRSAHERELRDLLVNARGEDSRTVGPNSVAQNIRAMSAERLQLRACPRIPELDHAKGVARDDSAVAEDANSPDERALAAETVNTHAVDDAAGLDVPFSEAAVRAAGDEPGVGPSVLFLFVTGVVRVRVRGRGRGFLWRGFAGDGGTPGKGEDAGLDAVEAAVMGEGVVSEGEDPDGAVLAGEGELG